MRQRWVLGRKHGGGRVVARPVAPALLGALRGDCAAQQLEELRAVEARGGRVERCREQGARRYGRRLRGRVRGRGLVAQPAAADRAGRGAVFICA
jgi:hypothetical protein